MGADTLIQCGASDGIVVLDQGREIGIVIAKRDGCFDAVMRSGCRLGAFNSEAAAARAIRSASHEQ